MNYKNFTASLVLGALVFSATASAAPSSSTLVVTASEITNSPSAPLRLVATNTLNETPTSICLHKLYGKMSATDGSSQSGRWLLSAKTSKAKKVTFTYRGSAVRLSNGVQSQVNLQAVTVCSRATITSNAAATNVTCRSGVSSSNFIKLLRTKMRQVVGISKREAHAPCE